MEKEKQIDECLELIKKMYSINQEREELIEQRAEKEAEFKAYLREQDKAIEAAKDRFNVIGRTVIDTDIKNTGHLRDEVKNAWSFSELNSMGICQLPEIYIMNHIKASYQETIKRWEQKLFMVTA